MSGSTYFVQECPTCGRRLHVRVDYLGKRVVCQHCRGAFIAFDPAGAAYPRAQTESFLRRIDQLLQYRGEQAIRPRITNPR
jgi:hypothetical protein